MSANYNKLWKIIIDRNIRKENLRVARGITTTAMAKIAKGMACKIPFKQLPFLQKRNVFVMIRESISAYILNELTEKEENKYKIL